MWQGWVALFAGLWITICSFIWQFQTPVNLLITGIILIVIGFWANKSLAGIILGFLGIWLAGSGLTNYLSIAVNYLLTGLTIIPVALLCATYYIRAKFASGMQ